LPPRPRGPIDIRERTFKKRARADNGSKVVWFLTGAAIGAAIAMLYAPATGRETRRFIRKKTEEGGDAIADVGKQILEHGREYYEKGRKIAEDAGEVLERGRKLVSR
jgi:gas vesicle protein